MSISEDDDEHLKRAIAISLQDVQTQKIHEVINLENEDEDVILAKEASLLGRKGDSRHRSGSPDTAVPNEVARASSTTLSFLGIDRKKMEQERLARKRKASGSPPPNAKAARTAGGDPFDPTVQSLQSSANTKGSVITNANASSESENHLGSRFPQGTVKKTWAYRHPRRGDDIKLEEILQSKDLNLAVLSSFQWDIEWLLAKLNTRSTLLTLVMQAKDNATKDQYRRETADMPNLRLCFPSMEGQVNCMHSKLMLLSHSTYLRIAIPTANLVRYDWGETGDMENMVFLIDLPRLKYGQATASNDITPFGRELTYFLKAMGLEQSIIGSLSNFDFAATKDLAFVHTIGGAHTRTTDSWWRTGYCGLGRSINEMGLATDSPLEIEFVTSSVGSLNMDFLSMLYLAAQGDDGITEYNWRNPDTGKSKTKKSKADLAEDEAAQEATKEGVRTGFHIYFPTHETVKASTAGGAGTICFQSRWYNSPTFPRQGMRDCKSTREGLLMHNKIIYVRRRDNATPSSSEGSTSTSWAYIGSANCSESAWGKLTKDRSTKTPKLNCRNWECGVVIPLGRTGARTSGLDAFQGVVPVPMQFPGEAYGNRKPYYYAEQ